VSSTSQQLESLDSQGELSDAFTQSDACSGLTTTGS
jgi:hypothetical protein